MWDTIRYDTKKKKRKGFDWKIGDEMITSMIGNITVTIVRILGYSQRKIKLGLYRFSSHLKTTTPLSERKP
jgi:hypothetical protein